MYSKTSTITRFLLPIVIILIIAPAVFVQYLSEHQLNLMKKNTYDQVQSLMNLLEVNNQLIAQDNHHAILLLKANLEKFGWPHIDGTMTQNDSLIPNLMFGSEAIANNKSLLEDTQHFNVDKISIFVKSNNQFVLANKSVMTDTEQKHFNQPFLLDNKISRTLLDANDYVGTEVINRTLFIVQYTPIVNKRLEVIGAYYVAQQVDSLAFMRAINQHKLIDKSVTVVKQEQQNILYHSDHYSINQVESLLKSRPKDWVFVEEKFEKWHASVLIAYPLSEAQQIGLKQVWQLIANGTILGILIIGIILLQLKRLILKPIGADPELVISLMQKTAKGDLEEDILETEPETLLAYVVDMRRKLKTSFNQLQDNAKRLSLSSSVFDNAHDGIFITDADLKIVNVNRSFTKITGYPKEAVIGEKPSHLGFAFQDNSYFEKALVDIALKNQCRGEVWNLHADGNVYAAWLDIFAVYDDDKKVTSYIGLFSDITEVKQQRKNLEHMAYHDPLTQLPNRILFSDCLKKELQEIHDEELLAICYFDLDDFKPVNDLLGHEAGDKLLVSVATRMRNCFSEYDTIARLGGDEFAVLLSGLCSSDECKAKLDKLLEEIKRPYEIDGQMVKVSASIGYTLYPTDLSEPDTLLRHADHAMYHVKVHGRGFHHQFDADQDRLTRNTLEEKEAIYAALPNGEFKLFYQPKVDMSLGKVIGFEALIRWQHPEKGLRSPIEFLPLIEQDTHLTIQIGEWVITETLHQITTWKAMGLSVKISVNISAKHMVQINFSERLQYLLSAFPKVNPQLLELEITETAVIEDVALVAKTIKECRHFGVSFALDDFGVGYSSLTYLRRLPVSVIKIDQSFIRDMLADDGDHAVVAGVISLGESFSLQVVAEGVETVEHGIQLLEMGCHLAQGYGISKPMEAGLVVDWVKQYQADERWLNLKKWSLLT